MVTIKDIAKAAGVSHVTVSNALNNGKGVSEKTKQKILAIAAQMNYKPNLAAKRLVDRKTRHVGLIWPSIKGQFFYHLSMELHAEGLKRDFNVIISMNEPAAALSVFNQVFADNVIFWCHSTWEPTSEFLTEKEAFQGKLLLIGGKKMDGALTISINRRKGIYEAVSFLAGQGHTRIAYAGGYNDKLEGFMQAGDERGLDFRREYLVHPNDEHFEAKMRSMLEHEQKPTALVADSHAVYLKVDHVLRKNGVRVPDDVSIIVYDDIPELEALPVPITTVGPSASEIAAKAFDMLTGIVKPADESDSFDLMIETVLTVRQSVKPAAP
ncbi:MAG: hypothetical protein K0Q94_397 [Paenibacillus sp.]|uniref:LacI family DNA-binding transcriptional regulator n=1 Tax=Paenibacillus sp. GCM10012303 TaxID=3317340 RepID=UPI0029ED6D9A|nr:hypothetical protein [Paenibacillus sp.]